MDPGERIDRQFIKQAKELKSKERRKIYQFVLFLISLSGVIFFMTKSSYLEISSVEITPSNRVVSHINYTNISEYSSRFIGKNYFLTRPERHVDKIIATDPYVEDVLPEKIFPNKILLNIKEREPRLLLVTGDLCVLLDKFGYTLQIEKLNVESPLCSEEIALKTDLVHNSDQVKADFPLGERSSYYEVEEILLSVNVLNGSGYKITTVSYYDDVYEYLTTNSEKILISNQQTVEIQLKRFLAVIEQIKSDKIRFEVLDLRYERPVVTL